jgi:Tfp pilus assembly PilM family ATPase
VAKRRVGLYIGYNTVDLVELRKGFGRVKLAKFGQAAISPELAAGGGEQLLQAIQKVFKETKIKAQEVVTTLPEEVLIIRYFRMPYLPKKEWNTAVRFEAKKYIPFKLEEIISDFQIVKPKKASQQMGVIFVAAKKESVDRHFSLLGRAGVKTAIIEAPSFSLMRLFHLTKEIKKDETTVIIDVNIGSATINILKNEVLYLTRNVILVKKTETSGEASEFENLLSELHLSFDYYKKQFPGENISRIILSGDNKLEGWDKLLTQELKVPVVVGDFSKAIEGGAKMPPGLAVASGLALRGLTRQVIEINLALPEKKVAVPTVKPIKLEAVQRIIFAEVAIIGILLLVIYLAMFTKLSAEKKELNALITQRPQVEMKLNVEGMELSELRKTEGDMVKKLHLLESLVDRRLYWTEKLSNLGKFFPAGTWINHIEIIDTLKEGNILRSLIIEGNAFSPDKEYERELVENVLKNIRGDKSFTRGIPKVNLISIEKGI